MGDFIIGSIFGFILPIVGVFCGLSLSMGETGLLLWIFALGGDILALFFVGGISEYRDSPIVTSIIGIVFWGIGQVLLFNLFNLDDSDIALAWICFAGLFIAPYFIVASLDIFFENTVSMVLIGIAKLTSSILFYSDSLRPFDKNNEITWKFIGYIGIVSFLALLSFILTILAPAVCSIKKWKEESQKQKKIKKESKRKQIKEKYSYQLISAVEKNDAKMVASLLEKGADVNYKDFSAQTPLLIAVKNCDKIIISFLLEKGANIECIGENGRTPLLTAVQNGNLDIVALLLEKGANINSTDSSYRTALDLAIQNENADLISLLLEKGAEIGNDNSSLKTALDLAIENKDADLVSLLLEKGAEIGNDNSSLKTALDFAIKNDNTDLLSFLAEKAAQEDVYCEDKPILFFAIKNNYKSFVEMLIEKGANINYIASHSWIDNDSNASSFTATALSEAVKSNNEEMVAFLIEKGADINLEVNNNEEYYYTMLQEAVYVKNKKIVSLLLDAGADINKNSRNNVGTALINAVETKFYDPEIVSLLIERGADANLESAYNGHTPLTFAVSQNNKNAVLLLLKNGADPNKKSSKFGSPLMIAFQKVNKEMCSLLIENGANPDEVLCVAAAMPTTDVAQFFLDRGANVNCENSNGNTPLTTAISFHQKEMVLFLISNGADVNFERSNSTEKKIPRTPLESAINIGDAEIVSLLITYGADVNYKTKNGNTPLLFAALHGEWKLVPILKEAGAISFVPAKGAQTTTAVAMKSADSDLQNDSAAFNSALVALSKIIAKNGAEIFSAENSQKLKAFISDLIPKENEIAEKLKQAFSCDFAQIILDSTDESDGKKEKSLKKSVDKIISETKLEKETAISIVKLVALSLGWDLENLNLG